jgi:fructose-1-phosphate kinase PfkB-like protein
MSAEELDAAYTIVVGLNAALQKRFILAESNSSLSPGSVHRAAEIHREGVGGKGQDVLLALACLSSPTIQADSKHSRAVIAQFLGQGAEGDIVQSLLNEYGMDPSLTVRVQSRLRTCTTIVGSSEATELVEPSGIVTKQEIEKLLNMVEIMNMDMGEDRSDSVRGLCFMGSMPKGCPEDLYARLFKKFVADRSDSAKAREEICCVVDTVVGLESLLQQMAECAEIEGVHKNMLKINLSELCKLTNISKNESESGSMDDVQKAIVQLFQKVGEEDLRTALKYITITDGKHPAYLVRIGNKETKEDVIYRIKIPDLIQSSATEGETFLYPIGAGDAVAAGTLASWEYMLRTKQNWNGVSRLDERIRKKLSGGKYDDEVVAAVAFGLACGSASCFKEENSVFDTEDALRLFEQIEVHRILRSGPIG